MKAHFLCRVAENDDQREPESKNVLRDEFAVAKLPAEIEVYAGAAHAMLALGPRHWPQHHRLPRRQRRPLQRLAIGARTDKLGRELPTSTPRFQD